MLITRLVEKKSSTSSYKKRLAILWKDNVVSPPFKLSVLLIILLLSIVLVFYWQLPPQIPLTYSHPWGESQLIHPVFLFALVVVVIIISILNNLIAAAVYAREQILSRIIVWAGFILLLLIDVTVIKIIFLVI